MTTAMSAAPVQHRNQIVSVFKDGRWQEAPRHQVEGWLVQVMLITPEWAAKVLEQRNKENRDEKPAYQERLVHALQTGRFFLTNQGVGFYDNGQLADGQNRLASIVKSGVSARMVVVFGIDPAAKPAIDDGVKRSDVDVARLLGDRETPKRAIMIANTLISMMRNGITYPDKYEKQDFYRKYMEGLVWTHTHFLPVKRKGITQMGVLSAVTRAYYTVKDDPNRLDRLKAFIRVLNEGIGDPNKDRAAVKLRNMLLDEKEGSPGRSRMNSGYAREEVYRKTEKAIQHFLREEPIDKLYEARDELFPLPGEHEFFGRLTRDEEAPVAGSVSVTK